MGNASREVMENLKASGEYTAERIAEFPFWDEYKDQLKSDIADLKNIGGKIGRCHHCREIPGALYRLSLYPSRYCGAIFNKTRYKYFGKGGSGVGVRILYNFFLERSQ